MKKAFLLLFILCTGIAGADVVIVNETPKDFYSLEHVHVSGDLRDNLLGLQGSGEIITGTDVKVYLMGPGFRYEPESCLLSLKSRCWASS